VSNAGEERFYGLQAAIYYAALVRWVIYDPHSVLILALAAGVLIVRFGTLREIEGV
jgi:hypothetical protein